jgi:hypothetical protein
MIVDYSFARPDPAALASIGVTGVIRYLAHDLAKAASIPEIHALHARNISTAFVFEDTASRPEQGKAAGDADGAFATTAAVSLGVPAGRVIYAACDFDIPDYDAASSDARLKLGPVYEYLSAFGAQLAARRYQLGVYGGYWAVTRAYWAQLTGHTWWTPAWSGGNSWERATLFQPGMKVLDGTCDVNFAGVPDWGQWRTATVNLTGGMA